MAEDVVKEEITEELIELAKAWYSGDFEIDYYNYYICTTTEGLIQRCKEEHKADVMYSEIEDMCKLDLLEFILNKKDEEKMFPQFIADRVAFIKKLQTKFNYPASRLQQIIAYENRLLPYSSEACEFYYADRKNIYAWLIKRISFEADIRKEYLSHLQLLDNKCNNDSWEEKYKKNLQLAIKRTEEEIAALEENSDDLSKRKWEKLSEDEKISIKIFVYTLQLSDEGGRRFSMKHYYDKVLGGYSPQVEFKDQEMTAGKLEFGLIDWGETLISVQEYNKFIDFFRTPYFSIEINGAEILIKITDPQQVSAPLMRMIEKIYTIMKGRLGRKRKGWGEHSGRRFLIRKRDEEMRRLYANWRKTTPNVGSNILIDRLCEYSKKVKVPVTSIERIKRIIYSKENKS